jgi:hypothetical protein
VDKVVLILLEDFVLCCVDLLVCIVGNVRIELDWNVVGLVCTVDDVRVELDCNVVGLDLRVVSSVEKRLVDDVRVELDWNVVGF